MNVGESILKMLKSEVSENEYNRYIKQLEFCEDESKSDRVLFYAPNPLVINWSKNRYAEKISHLFEIKTGVKPSVVFGIKNQKQVTSVKNITETPVENKSSVFLNPSHTFENFVIGSSNQFAAVAAKNVSENPGSTYNPLYIYGGVGLGKTHMMQAIGNVLANQGKTVIFTSVEQFLNDFTRHMRNGTMDRFKDKYRKCDALLIDDIQFLSNKTQTQEEFFHTFNTLKDENKQIVMTSDKHPKQIAGIEDRLISRFEWGLVADIQPPELETKIAIIKKKCEINRISISNEVINYIATIISNNAREIEGILSKLSAYARIMHQDISIDFAKSVLKDQLQEKKDHITMDYIVKVVSKELNVKPAEIKSKGRARSIVYARRVAIYLSRELTPNSMPQIAQYFGLKDHTAVSHMMKKIQDLLKNDEDFKVKIDELKNKITYIE